jgi:ribonuclease P protein component
VPKFKHSSVDRNRLKRRLRELSRTRILPLNIPVDVVFRIRPDAYGASFEALTADVERALAQLQKLPLATPADPVTNAGPTA